MSIYRLNDYLASGTNAERLAIVSEMQAPAAGPDGSRYFWETDTETLWVSVDTADPTPSWTQVGGGGVADKTRVITVTIDGGGATITTGVKGFVRVPVACTITANYLLSTDAAATAGSIVIDVWKDTYANYPPTVADTITASAKPTLSAANKSNDTTLTGWTTSVAAGDILGFNVDSATTVTKVTLFIILELP